MIIAIGGPSGAGKTFLAGELMRELGISILQLDYIMMGLSKGLPKSGINPEKNDRITAEKMWPVTESILKTYIENEQHVIIEGVQLPPDKISEFLEKYPDRILPFFLTYSGKYLEKNFKNINRFRDCVEKRIDPAGYSPEEYMHICFELKKECKNLELELFEIDRDFENSIKTIKKRILSRWNTSRSALC